MSFEYKELPVHVEFSGKVNVRVPVDASDQLAREIATEMAKARMLATYDNQDAPEEAAFDTVLMNMVETDEDVSAEDLEPLWDNSDIVALGGAWRTYPAVSALPAPTPRDHAPD